jgi:KaiC/GvpD/RAD55 family RecA-like ATPase
MDAAKNPFTPGAGSPPPELVGRDIILEQVRVLLSRVRAKRAEKSLLMTGLRGMGKTVLLNEMSKLAEREGYQVIYFEAEEDARLAVMLAPQLRRLLYELDRGAGMGDKVRRGLRVLKSFLSGIKVSYGDLGIGIDVEEEKGIADSGDLAMDLSDLFVAVSEAAQEHRAAVAILIDEIQYFSLRDLGALIVALHKMQQRQLPLLLVGAGLPTLPQQAGEAKSYAERLFHFPDIGQLSEPDAAKALQDPVRQAGVEFTPEALSEIFRWTRGYPYFIQEWGYQAWNHASQSPITAETVRQATTTVVERLDKNFFRVRFDRLTPREKHYLRVMAELGSGPYRAGDIAKYMGIKRTTVSPIRDGLIKKGMIYSPAYGDVAFTVPLFEDFMRRVIPLFDPKKPLKINRQ